MAIAAFARVCAKNVTGNLKVWIAETANMTTVTITSNEISAVGGTGIFHRVQPTLDNLQRTEKVEGGAQGHKFTHELKMSFAKPSKNLKLFIESLIAATPCGMTAIILDGNGQAWMIGYNATDLKDRGLKLVDTGLDTGLAPGEDGKGQFDVTLRTLCSEMALPFDATQTAAIAGESATYLTTS